MRMLFEIDKKNYEKGGKTARRPSVRGIINKRWQSSNDAQCQI